MPAADRGAALENLSILLRDEPWFELGVWAEQARLSALAGETGFFTEPAARVLGRIARRVERERGGDDPLTGKLREVRQMVADGVSPAELPRLHDALTEVMREAGG